MDAVSFLITAAVRLREYHLSALQSDKPLRVKWFGM